MKCDAFGNVLFQIFSFSPLPLFFSLSFSPSWEKCFFPLPLYFFLPSLFCPSSFIDQYFLKTYLSVESSFHLTRIKNYQESSRIVKNIVLVDSPPRQALSLLYSPQDFLSPGEQKLLKTQTQRREVEKLAHLLLFLADDVCHNVQILRWRSNTMGMVWKKLTILFILLITMRKSDQI